VGCRILTIALIAVLATACTTRQDAATSTLPTPSTVDPIATATTPSPTPSATEPLTTGPNVRPGEQPPEYPALARRHTAQGALAFAAYYYEAFDWGYATNDPFLVASISARTCSACSKYIHRLQALRA
jgi:Family of unknown function (DUF6318)